MFSHSWLGVRWLVPFQHWVTAVLVLKSWVCRAGTMAATWLFFRKICREAHEMLLVSDSYPKLLIQIPFHKWNDDWMIRNGLINLYLFLEFSGWTATPKAVASPIHFSLQFTAQCHWGSCALEPSRILECSCFAVSSRFQAFLCRYDGVNKWKE